MDKLKITGLIKSKALSMDGTYAPAWERFLKNLAEGFLLGWLLFKATPRIILRIFVF
jgi:hypothetical protein